MSCPVAAERNRRLAGVAGLFGELLFSASDMLFYGLLLLPTPHFCFCLRHLRSNHLGRTRTGRMLNSIPGFQLAATV